MDFQHLFFDLDNTLWDHRKNAYLTLADIFEHEKLHRLGFEFEDFHRKYDEINERLWEEIRDGKIDKEHLRKHRFYDTFLHFGIDDLDLGQKIEYQFLDEIIRYNELVEGSIDLLDYLREKDYHLHIISNGFHEITHRKINFSGLSPYFKTVTSADDVGVRKPNPKIFQHALEKANAHKDKSLLIGDDWVADIQGAQNFGLDVVFFDVFQQGVSDESPLFKSIHSLKELKLIL